LAPIARDQVRIAVGPTLAESCGKAPAIICFLYFYDIAKNVVKRAEVGDCITWTSDGQYYHKKKISRNAPASVKINANKT